MKYLRKIYENESLDKNSIIALKSLPYKDFVTSLTTKLKGSDLRSTLDSLERNTDLSEDFGQVKMGSIPAKSLVPTQSQIGLKETLSWMSNPKSIKEIIVDGKATLYMNNRILIANNKWILDGHHRWSYVYMLNPGATIPCININLPGRTPQEILKDVQLAIAATYNDLYTRQVPMQLNLSRMEDKSIIPSLRQLINEEKMLELRGAYGAVDTKKYILREFIVPEELLEQRVIRSTDYIESEITDKIDPEMKELDETDNNNPDKDKLEQDYNDPELKDKFTRGESLQSGLDVAGVIDPSGILDMVSCVMYLYKKEYALAGLAFISAAAPYAGDLIAKPLMAVLKSQIMKKITKALGNAMKNFDAKKAAKIFVELEKTAPEATRFLEKILSVMNDVIVGAGKILDKIGQNWIKFRLFYHIFAGRFKKFFEDLLNWRQRLKEYLNTTTEAETFGMLATNLVNIKRLIVDKGVDKLNVNFSIGVHPVQTAVKARMDPFKGSFKGVPTALLENLPKVVSKIPMVAQIEKEEVEEKGLKPKVKDFKTFKEPEKSKKGDETAVKPKAQEPKSPQEFKTAEPKIQREKEKDSK